MKIKFGVMSLVLVLAAFAQPPASTPSQAPVRGMMGGRGPALRSPEILDDQKVTFRLRAPNAGEVLLNGDWPQGRASRWPKTTRESGRQPLGR